jgi:formate dehydrogenase iron-sulfur subunit
VEGLHANGFPNAQLYGDQDGLGATGGVRSLNSFSLLMDEPQVYGLPAAPTLPARNIMPGLTASLATGSFLIGATLLALLRRS